MSLAEIFTPLAGGAVSVAVVWFVMDQPRRAIPAALIAIAFAILGKGP